MNIPKLPNFKGLGAVVKTFTMAHRPELLLGASVATTLGAVGMAAKGGYEARGKVDAARLAKVNSPEPPFDTFAEYYEAALESVEDLTVKEKIQETWSCYLPAAGLTVGALGSTAGLHIIHVKEKKAMAAAALMAVEEVRTEAQEYITRVQNAVEENTDKETVEKIGDDILDPDKTGTMKSLPVNGDHVMEEFYLVRDGRTGRDIWSNQARIDDAILNVNNAIQQHGDCDLNSFYSNAGFEVVPDGDDWGWSGGRVHLKWDAVTRDDGRAVRRFTFQADPEKGYDRPLKPVS